MTKQAMSVSQLRRGSCVTAGKGSLSQAAVCDGAKHLFRLILQQRLHDRPRRAFRRLEEGTVAVILKPHDSGFVDKQKNRRHGTPVLFDIADGDHPVFIQISDGKCDLIALREAPALVLSVVVSRHPNRLEALRTHILLNTIQHFEIFDTVWARRGKNREHNDLAPILLERDFFPVRQGNGRLGNGSRLTTLHRHEWERSEQKQYFSAKHGIPYCNRFTTPREGAASHYQSQDLGTPRRFWWGLAFSLPPGLARRLVAAP